VRWSNLTTEGEEQRRLPGYRDEAVVRRFDAPEALQTRFYEVRARSVLNRVPERSRMPFRWTINPYRGCAHACTFCVHGDTPVLMADGRHVPMAELELGDEIYGTAYSGRYRRYVRTSVIDRWITVKRAYRVRLADGTELVASGDHRFLTDRGWKHVTGTSEGQPNRAHLTIGNRLIGTGAFATHPHEAVDYRRGYLCGLIRGDGCIWSSSDRRRGGRVGERRHFRLALADFEALSRAKAYLVGAGVSTSERTFQCAHDRYREMRCIAVSRRPEVGVLESLIEWPALPTFEWCRGFLAGIFDAEGSRSGFAMRIANTDPEILAWTEACARRLGFSVAQDRTLRSNGLTYIRITGGTSEHLRFFHLTNPAITRKCNLDGQMVKTFADLRVIGIEDLEQKLPLYDITTGTGDFIANGVVSHNCFARPTHKYLGFDAGRDFEREIVVKVNAPEVLRAELARRSWRREHVALGTNTDPYQWVEGRYRLMEGIWEALRDAANPCSILTKSPLLLRDLALMLQIAERASFSACLSIPTLDEKAWRASEPHTPNPRARLEAVAELNRAGIPTGVLVAPLMPGINDSPAQVERLLELVEQAGATSVSGIALHLRGEVRQVFMDWLRAQRPDLVPRYERLYRRGAYAPPEERKRLARMVRGRGRPGRIFDDRAGDRPADAEPGSPAAAAGRGSPPSRNELAQRSARGAEAQQALF
jgi:DNA repair photolyase